MGPYWFPHFASLWIVGIVAFRILMVWVYNNSGSVLLGQLMHASLHRFAHRAHTPAYHPANETFWYAIYSPRHLDPGRGCDHPDGQTARAAGGQEGASK